jgi:hypothetical protein
MGAAGRRDKLARRCNRNMSRADQRVSHDMLQNANARAAGSHQTGEHIRVY